MKKIIMVASVAFLGLPRVANAGLALLADVGHGTATRGFWDDGTHILLAISAVVGLIYVCKNKHPALGGMAIVGFLKSVLSYWGLF